MARPPKQGLDYFPKDVGFYNDFKIMDLLALHGPIGVTVYEVILTEVYQNGYYLAEPIDRISTKIVRIIGAKWVQKRLVSQVILDCGDLGLFETTLLKHGVITSVGIQRRYASVTSRNKVNKDRYWLIDENGQPLLNAPFNRISATETLISATETVINDAEIPQKERKGNKTKEKNISCSELGTSPRMEAAYKLILNNGDHHQVTKEDIESYRELYPAVDIEQEIRKMIGWLDANPKNRKTRLGIRRFINGWLSRAQDSARVQEKRVVKPKPNEFHNFEQRDTDYDSIVLEQTRKWAKEGEGDRGGDAGVVSRNNEP